MIEILLPAFLLSIVLVGIHAFFGMEVIRRGIIFTDLAIGQTAALGAAVSLCLWDGGYAYPASLLFALAAAALIALVTRRQAFAEAFIGLLYAGTLAGVFVLLSRSPHGMEKFQTLMATDILFTPLPDIAKAAALYSVLGAVMFFLYPRLKGLMKDLLFFVAFALTVTSSVRMAGVLIVFSLLVGPAFIAIKIRSKHPLIMAWTLGTLINLVAVGTSYGFDLPTGYTLVLFHAVAALACGLLPEKQAR